MSLESALALIESVKDYKVLVVGDSIIDEYHYVLPLGKAAKEYLIPVEFYHKEIFMGGVEAAAKHLESFCKTVELCASPTAVRKVRMVDINSLRKLFEIHYDINVARNNYMPGTYDAVIVADFGHKRISEELIEKFAKVPFLAVSAQTNSSNIGYNLITKYQTADYVVIDEPEARLAAADRDSTIETVMRKLADGRYKKLIVTHGRHGAYGLENGKFYHQKSHTDLVRDTMGAGDAFFAVTAPMAKTGSIEDLLLIGNASGAVKCGIVGHREPVTKKVLIEYLKAGA